MAAASSLTEAFESYGEDFNVEVRFSFAGSDELAAQIRNGARPDLFAAAEKGLPQQLHREGLVERPIVFASNKLVLAVPAKQSGTKTIADLANPGVDVVIGAHGVPVGDYARELLSRLPDDQAGAIRENIRSEEPDAKSIVAKLIAGAADAGLIYVTDAKAAGGALRAIALPRSLQPEIAYAAAIVAAADSEDAQRFLDGLFTGKGAEALRAAGFGPPLR